MEDRTESTDGSLQYTQTSTNDNTTHPNLSTSDHKFTARPDTTVDSPQRDDFLQIMNNKVLDEYERGQQEIATKQQDYRTTLELFLNFAANNKNLYQRVLDMHRQAEKNAEKLKQSNTPKISLHLRIVSNINSFYTDSVNVGPLYDLLVKSPYIALPAFEEAIAEIWRSQESKILLEPPRLGICGWLGRHHVTPRGLNSSMLNTMVAVEGVVNKCSIIRPKLTKSVYVGELPNDFDHEKTVYVRPHYDITDFGRTLKDSGNPPPTDPDGKIVHRHEIGLCSYKSHQTFVIQETPEDSPAGQMPRWVNAIVDNDLCNTVKCGDRVWGVYRIDCGRADGTNSGIGRPWLVANYISIKNKESISNGMKITEQDKKNFQTFASRSDTLQVLIRSFAPSICGQEAAKRGILLQLVGGPQTRLDSEHHIRGDIHTLLVGDPSCGKSQLLRYVMNLVPTTVSATGRGSSGVGLTAAIVTDSESGERRVEGGAMVMGDKRIVCIDEFDKMAPTDRVSIHEVMEQQTVTISKAGIHTTLNARCSVLAAANPLYGCWSDDMDVSQQLNFEHSLMTRFDLIFVIRDSATEAEDDRIAEAILRNVTQKAKPITLAGGNTSFVIQPSEGDMTNAPHLSFYNGEQMAVDSPQNKNKRRGNKYKNDFLTDGETAKVFESPSDMLYMDQLGREFQVLTVDFFKRYLHYAKDIYYKEKEATEGWKPYPEISDEARHSIVCLYSQLRQRAYEYELKRKRLPQSVSPRTLEAIIRLSTAHARLKLNKWVTEDNVRYAKKLLNHTLFGEPCDISDDEEDFLTDSEFDPNEMDEDEASAKRDRGRRASIHPDGADIRPFERRSSRTTSVSSRKGETLSLSLQDVIIRILSKLDNGDGVKAYDLWLEVVKEAKELTKDMNFDQFKEVVTEINSSEFAPLLYATEEDTVFSC